MKAIRIHEFGGPEVLRYEDVPEPKPGPDEIRIRVIAAGVNPMDWKVRQGGMSLPLPMIMGIDVAGVVDALGSKVNVFKPGDHVFAKLSLGQGGYAEYAVTNTSQAALKPKSIGVDAVIDYRAQRFEDVVQDVDVVLDTIGGDTFERSWGEARRAQEMSESHHTRGKIVLRIAEDPQ